MGRWSSLSSSHRPGYTKFSPRHMCRGRRTDSKEKKVAFQPARRSAPARHVHGLGPPAMDVRLGPPRKHGFPTRKGRDCHLVSTPPRCPLKKKKLFLAQFLLFFRTFFGGRTRSGVFPPRCPLQKSFLFLTQLLLFFALFFFGTNSEWGSLV